MTVNGCIVVSGSLSFKVIKGFHEVKRITMPAGTAHGMSGIITFAEKDPEATINAYQLLGLTNDY